MIEPRPVYSGADSFDRPERRGVSRRTVIEEAKAKVPTIDFADLLVADSGGGWRRSGARWVVRCPLPGHEDRSPSFVVFPDNKGWYCFGACQTGGDVVDLAAAAWGFGRGEMAMAAAALLHEFGEDVPPRPASWFEKQKRQHPIRSELERIKVEVLCRRLFRWVFEPMIGQIGDEEERAGVAEYVWKELIPLAHRMVEERRQS